MADKLKLSLAAVVLFGAIAAFYVYEDVSTLLRVVGVLVGAGVAAAIALQTARGRQAREFVRGATIEARKVVWPTRKETVQTTLIVLVMVILVGILLWLLDMFLLWAVGLLTGQGG
ncbi:preprotein translocase subunit SecE [Thiohalospira halophila DSM 15071]|uniref:Protein translocase subunit SecE n=1 Tax=Thiohalospira halophila DSM 15071 TaxID=1123397 RepID=A0A1I1WK29_9GAMM|nr:preprotein translocase subunit SecE [Thiohalospira halophila]SFD95574.1 preprotein translocase subunit SecE [Thiohalospira halophila DSM 15071]